jgi:hypothetical protein
MADIGMSPPSLEQQSSVPASAVEAVERVHVTTCNAYTLHETLITDKPFNITKYFLDLWSVAQDWLIEWVLQRPILYNFGWWRRGLRQQLGIPRRSEWVNAT